MIAALIRFALIQRLMMLLVAAAVVAGGLWAFRTLPIDAFPDISPPQVQVIVKASGLAPTEVESRIAFPIEMEMQGIPNLKILRSTTKYALSNIIIDFEDGTDIYWARQQVAERLSQVKDALPKDAEVVLAPIATPLSDIYMYRIKGEGISNSELRTIQDWVIRPRLRAVDGVADVNSLGGLVRAFEVQPDPGKLADQGLSIEDLERAIERNNRNAGGDRVNRKDKMLLVRTVGQLKTADDIRRITVVTRGGIPVRVGDVARVAEGSLVRYGGATANGEGEIVTGLALLRVGANSRTVVEAVKQEIALLAPSLPKGVTIEPYYDRADLINASVFTVEKALGEAVVLVVVVLIVLLGNLRAALTVALILPLSVLITFILMKLFGVSANLMSLGGLAIAIGILVDAAVVVVENIHTQLAQPPKGVSRLHLVYRAVVEVATPVLSGILIIVIVFLPLFTLTGLEGRMFKPLALTIVFALMGSLLLSLSVIPVFASFLMRGGAHGEDRVMAAIKRVYLPAMRWVLAHRKTAVVGAFVLLVAAAALFPLIGKEFMPTMDEGQAIVSLEKASDISLEASLALDKPIQMAILEIPDVTGVICRSGADELRLDPMGFYQTDCFLQTKPRKDWGYGLDEFQNKLREKLEPFEEQGVEAGFSQPIDMRVSEMLSGVRADVAIKLFGDDFSVLEKLSGKIEEIVKRTNGSSDVFRARLSGQGYLTVNINSEKLARYGLNNEDVNEMVETAVGGKVVTEIIEGSRRFGVQVRYPEAARASPVAIKALLIKTPGGAMVPLGMVADVREVDGPVLIQREAARRLLTVRSNVEGRDVVSFVEELKSAIEREVKLPEGYHISYGGQFENQQRAAARLGLVVPISIALILFMLFTTFGSLRQAGLILLNIPFALIGGVVSLYLSGLYLSVPASVGFITLFGVAVLNGVVMVSYFNQLREAGRTVLQAVQEGAERRLRPVLMTALIASLGLMPMLLATGPGSELQRPLAVVVIGGLFTSTLLTLLLLPTLYAWVESRSEQRVKNSKGKTL
ncbi:MAG: CusA/CzcA family heavy metal efflux RND transporter [Gallionellales bacterium 35-53-114]|jgi:cobalt-zinc-cadmium resistance protein CzcA|nr:MAG: CusA/CzcA family heavy metal efflux RND transporter [Gallionellales bacterium 35-53-114]OYZ64911.1 MAG: CusA/CzcA family heavy metal efflux RND transporter [Gallionellales bacterium 24-53-125]OZB07552.1 MAG: CusA/CzcA family heavy metal efflux RND transporter [Gallionellales bacterium 39-52-133]HQS58772.1 CusA/CzcA family heavy metal efflux RND transporter [Gallionellaceae bacterium]HQS75112.1 CusA/CzcA family heavy metal efflux RND transporter [Gallionellaceae bacterium]